MWNNGCPVMRRKGRGGEGRGGEGRGGDAMAERGREKWSRSEVFMSVQVINNQYSTECSGV